ncbi:MAG TPA: hypothetical protein VGG02_12065 [Chthoniobacterales bacterium]|jgi:hypothetical protein
MKTTSLTIDRQPLARHDARASGRSPGAWETDYHFQTQLEKVSTAAPAPTRADLRAFRKMSDGLVAEEARGSRLAEFGAYALIAGLMAWSLIALAILLAQTARG